MKIACIGNMNNNLFSLVRYLRDAGMDAELILLNNELAHFMPWNDTFDLEYNKYTRRVAWGDIFDFRKTPARQIKEDLRKYNFIIGCSTSPGYVHKAGRKLDIFIPYGNDLFADPFRKWAVGRPRHVLARAEYATFQKKGIVEAGRIFGINLEKLAGRLFPIIKNKIMPIQVPMVYAPLYNPETLRDYSQCGHWLREFRRIRDQSDLVIFYHSRHIWKNLPDEISLKGTDVLIRGFSQFCQREKNIRPALIMLEYGGDVNESKRLISTLGVEGLVHWFPLMERKDIMLCLNEADIGTGTFSKGSLSNGVILENLALAKPLLHYREDSRYESVLPELYPLMNAKNSDAIADYLEDYLARPDYYREMGQRGRSWFLKHCVNEPILTLRKMINNE
jgi:glycosyltransferase involved in cell wall biosynthesis